MKSVLQVFTNRRMAITALLAFSSGLPLPLVTGTLDAWMTRSNVSLKTIGMFSLVGVPYTVKYLWAPLLDRYVPPFLNRRSGWMVIFQLCLVVGIAGMAFVNPVASPWLMAALAFVVAFFSASQDIVIDAYRAELLEPNELGAGAGITVLGARLALLTAGALALILSDHISWRLIYLLMAGFMSIGLVTAIISPVPRLEAKPPKSLREAVLDPFRAFFSRDRAVEILLFIIVYKLGDAVAGKMTTPFLIKMGFTNSAIGTVNKGFGMVVTIFGALSGGAIIAKIGLWRSLFVFGILQALSNLVFIALAKMGPIYGLMVACIGVENICGGMGTAAFVAFLMSLCDKRFTATHYALLSSVMAISRTIAGAFTGFAAEGLGWPRYFLMSTFLAVPGILLLFRFRNLDAITPTPQGSDS